MNSYDTFWGDKGYGWINYKIAEDVIAEAYVISATKPKWFTFCGREDCSTSSEENEPSLDSIISEDVKLKIEHADDSKVKNGGMIFSIEIMSRDPAILMMCQDWKVYIRFFTVNARGEREPYISKKRNEKFANDQTAFKGEIVAGEYCEWKATVLFDDLKIYNANGILTRKKDRRDKTILYAEPVFYLGNSPIGAGQQSLVNLKSSEK